jgi:hypothetical protein
VTFAPVVTAVGVCPQAPGLVPAVGFGIAAELSEVRSACRAALDSVLATKPDRVVVVGDGGLDWDESAGGSFRGFGPDIRVGGPNVVLPPGLTVGAWLLDEAGWTGRRTYASVPQSVGDDERIGLLVMADGSARHRMLAPEWTDADGRTFDASVARALHDGDAAALASLDLAAAKEFHASGINGLVAVGEKCKGTRIEAHVRYDGAPFDVGYWVADWLIG